MIKFFNSLTKFFRKSPKKLSSMITKRYDEEYEGWLGV